jgi:glycosyltransferase involved in cell wall biosynthesis
MEGPNSVNVMPATVTPSTDAGATSPSEDARRRTRLSVAIPFLNEEKNIPALVERLRLALDRLDVEWEIIFIDDGSTDGSEALVRVLNAADSRIKLLSLSRNFGKEIAVAAGLRYVRGDVVVMMDADLQHPPEAIASFLDKWRQGYDIVYGQRADRDLDGAARRFAARLFYRIFFALSGTELPDGAGDFRLLNRRAIDTFNRLGERARFNKGLYAWIGFRSIGIPFEVGPRHHGETRWQPRRLLRFAVDGLASFSTLPLRIWSYVGVLVSAMAFLYVAIFLVKTMIFGIDVPGFPTLVIAVMLLSGVQLISLGVIGEYLGRVYEEVKGRPLFIVRDQVGLSDETSEDAAADRSRRSGAKISTPGSCD